MIDGVRTYQIDGEETERLRMAYLDLMHESLST